MTAIYMWLEGGITYLTTTLYPVDVVDSLLIDITFSSGSMSLIPSDSVGTDHTVLDMTYVQQRWFYSDGPYADSTSTDHIVLDMTYVQQRWFYEAGPYDDSTSADHTVLDMTYIRLVVLVDTPDEKLQLNVSIKDTCSMDLI